ncbi:MAG: beta-lactamase family protein, partial [Kofleriaceae bacterium]|nr:beta-lactamase family protein [Kofleriaceae bacterium]
MASREPEIHGDNAPDFSEVQRIFAENFTKRGELGASVCIWHRGVKVVDLWAGHVDLARTTPWCEDTMSTIFSSTKGLVALCFLILSDRGEFSYDDTVAQYWPEFAANGKESISIRTLLNHRAGLIGIDSAFTLDTLRNNPERVAEFAGAQAPQWEPGQVQGYHGVTYGIYAAELFQRIAGESLGAFLDREVRKRLNADVFLGLPADEEARVSDIFPVSGSDRLFKILPR